MTHKEKIVKEALNDILNLRTGWVEADKTEIRKTLRKVYDEGRKNISTNESLNENEQYSYTKEDLEKRLACIQENGKHVQKCLEYAIEKLSVYHNKGAKGLIVDDAMYDVYAKLDAALNAYKSYNDRVEKKINAKLEAFSEEEKRKSEINSRFPRRNI